MVAHRCWASVLFGLLAAVHPAMAATRSGCVGPVRVALDIGHTLSQPGATSARGTTEFGFNQALGRVVAETLARAGIATSVIGASGARLALAERTHEAQRAGATLFLSLHHDSVQPQYLIGWQVTGRALRYSDAFGGYSLFISGLNPRAQDSQRFATHLGARLNAAGFTPSLHHAEPIAGENRPLLQAKIGLYRFDELAVLRGAPMPAVLLEAGIIVNRQEEMRLQDPAAIARMADAIVSAIQQYCPA